MKIAFVSEIPPNSRATTGIPYVMARALRERATEFTHIEIPGSGPEVLLRGDEPARAEGERRGRFLTEQLRGLDVDAVVCRGASMIPSLQTEKPVVLWHDSTWFSSMRMPFEEFKVKHPLLHEWDRLALQRADLVVLAADWLYEGVVANYRIPPEKVHVIPFGANLDPPSEEAVRARVLGRDAECCRLAFLGLGWQRKNLPLAYGVVGRLKGRGVVVSLAAIGSDVTDVGWKRKLAHVLGVRRLTEQERFRARFGHDPSVRSVGRLDKNVPEQFRQLCDILLSSHFLLHTAGFEPYGSALVEANAFGLPVLTIDAYGPKTIVRNGINGQRFMPDEYAEGAAQFISQKMADPEAYRSLALSSLAEYHTRLNWSSECQKLLELLQQTLERG
jgi:glycosyltransferase involved in cell wall biosynthesis